MSVILRRFSVKKIVLALVLGALALTGAVLAPAALAQDPAPSCSLALQKQGEAERLHLEAVAADKALDAALAKDKELDDAKLAAEKAARAEGQPHAYNGPLTEAAAKAIEDRENPSPNDLKTVALIRAYLVAEKAALDFTVSQAVRDAAASDAVALKVKFEEATKAADAACKGKPGEPAPNDVDCDEVSRAEAQRILNADLSDPHNLDIDNDGIACETDIVRVVPQTSSGVDTGA